MGVYTGTGPTDPTVGSKASVTAFGVPTSDALQALVSAGTAWTPTLGNVTTGTVTATYTQVGKLVYISVEFTAGTATAAAVVTLSTPGSLSAVRTQGLIAMNAGAMRSARVTTTTITLCADTTGANFGAGMTGGMAYVYDPKGRFRALCNMAMVDVEAVEPAGVDSRMPSQISSAIRTLPSDVRGIKFTSRTSVARSNGRHRKLNRSQRIARLSCDDLPRSTAMKMSF